MSPTIQTEKNNKMSFLDIRVNLQPMYFDEHIRKETFSDML